jgi:Protein of unknown function (DUF3551)
VERRLCHLLVGRLRPALSSTLAADTSAMNDGWSACVDLLHATADGRILPMSAGKRQIVAAVWPALAVLVALALDLGVASAQPIIGRARWCMTLPLGGMMQCSYYSLEQCMVYAHGVSNQCSLNPWYEGPPPRQRKRKRHTQ